MCVSELFVKNHNINYACPYIYEFYNIRCWFFEVKFRKFVEQIRTKL